MSLEYVVSCVICTLFGLLFSYFAYMNLRGEQLGKEGRRFIFEMDVVMGGLLGLPRFSKIEGTVLGLGAVGAFLSWSTAPTHQLITVVGLMLLVIYLVVCSIYAVFARQPYAPYLGISGLLVGLGAWRATRMMPAESLQTVAGFVAFATVLCGLAGLQMRRRAPSQQAHIDKLVAILAFIEAHEDWDWPEGADAPIGFDAAQTSS